VFVIVLIVVVLIYFLAPGPYVTTHPWRPW
jgi:hypothetical protein